MMSRLTGRNFLISGTNSGHHNLPTYEMSLKSGHHYLPTYQILMILDNVEFLRPFSWHWKISTDRHFQNGRHNTAKIQHWPISSKFDMWVDNDIKFWWYRTMLNFCGIVVAILKMATRRNCSMSGINSGHHYLPRYKIVMIPFSKWPPQYHKNSTLSDIIKIWYVGR
jgi:hypothetical protein